MYAFACFVVAFDEVECFASMPWEERVPILKERYGVEVTDRTLRSWCSKLITQEVLDKDTGAAWKTEFIDRMKKRTLLSSEADFKDYQAYMDLRSELLEKYKKEIRLNEPEIAYYEVIKKAWKSTYYTLWEEFHCCYYTCKFFSFKSWNSNGYIREIIELAKEIRYGK